MRDLESGWATPAPSSPAAREPHRRSSTSWQRAASRSRATPPKWESCLNPFSDRTGAVVIPIADASRRKRGLRAQPKGRVANAKALDEVRALLGDSLRRRDLLIEFLHRIQDTYGCI